MMPSDLPTCPLCNNDTYRAGGGHFGGTLNQQGFCCGGCDASVQLLSHAGGGLLAFIGRHTLVADEHGDLKFPTAYHTWVDKTLLPTWRAHAEVFDDFRKSEWKQWLDAVFYPTFPNHTDYPGVITFYDLSTDAQTFIKAIWGENISAGSYLPPPPEILDGAYPPQAPVIPGVVFMIPRRHIPMGIVDASTDRETAVEATGDSKWELLDLNRSHAITPPEDPILRHNREFFEKVWTALSSNLGQALPSIIETRNRYGGIQPWFTFTLNGDEFTIGWRKRVIAIEVITPNEAGILTTDIAALAAADGVTYDTHGPLRHTTAVEYEAALTASYPDGSQQTSIGWVIEHFKESHPDGKPMRLSARLSPVAHQIDIHAWGLEKTVQYLTVLCQAERVGTLLVSA